MTIDSTLSDVTSVPTAFASAEDVTRVRDIIQPFVIQASLNSSYAVCRGFALNTK